MFEAVCAEILGITSREEIRLMPRHDASEAGAITSWLLKQNDRYKPNGAKSVKPTEVGWISAPAHPDHVKLFATHYRNKHRDASMPTKIATFVRHWRAWASQVQRTHKRQAEQAQALAELANDTKRATPEEVAAIKAELGVETRRKAERKDA